MDSKKKRSTKLRALGFCGADDSIDPNLLGLICEAYPFVEFGVLFRPDKEGTPRYASSEWVKKVGKIVSKSTVNMKLAAHLCGTRVNDILKGNDEFLSTLPALGFKRIQINATAVNGVDVSNLSASVPLLAKLMHKYKQLEFILQKNEETRPLWEGLLSCDNEYSGKKDCLPSNVTMLVDESKGTGVLANAWPNPPKEYDIGYAGGIGPKNIKKVLADVLEAGNGRNIWIDMESSLRSIKDGMDVFDLNKCYECIRAIVDAGCYDHPGYLGY